MEQIQPVKLYSGGQRQLHLHLSKTSRSAQDMQGSRDTIGAIEKEPPSVVSEDNQSIWYPSGNIRHGPSISRYILLMKDAALQQILIGANLSCVDGD